MLGWEFRSTTLGDHFAVALSDGRPVAGIGGIAVDLQIAVAWTPYFAVTQVDEAAARIRERSATVAVGPVAFASGRALVAADRDGAVFGVWDGRLPSGWETWNDQGPVVLRLRTRDAFEAAIFYGGVLEWADGRPDGCTVDYEHEEVVIRSRGSVVARLASGAVEAAPDPAVRPHWDVQFTVADIGDCVGAARALGGTLLRHGTTATGGLRRAARPRRRPVHHRHRPPLRPAGRLTATPDAGRTPAAASRRRTTRVTPPPNGRREHPLSASPLPAGTPADEGVDAKGVQAFLDALEAMPGATPHGLMILRHGKVVADGWWAPFTAGRPHLLYSLSKSFTSAAAGLAAADGLLDLDASVLSYFPELDADVTDPRSRAMLVRHVASMSSGHLAETWTKAYRLGGDEPVRGFLQIPPDRDPGTVFAYNQPTTYTLAAIVQRRTGQSLTGYLRPRLLDPLGIGAATWMRDHTGRELGFSGLFATTDAVARLGQLHLNGGRWGDRQLLPAAWVAEATRPHVANPDMDNPDWQQGYGLQFWMSRHGYRGDGAFGQFCVVLPEHDAVIALTSEAPDMQAVLDAAWRHLLPAFRPAPLTGAEGEDRALRARLDALAVPPLPGSTRARRPRGLVRRPLHPGRRPRRRRCRPHRGSPRPAPRRRLDPHPHRAAGRPGRTARSGRERGRRRLDGHRTPRGPCPRRGQRRLDRPGHLRRRPAVPGDPAPTLPHLLARASGASTAAGTPRHCVRNPSGHTEYPTSRCRTVTDVMSTTAAAGGIHAGHRHSAHIVPRFRPVTQAKRSGVHGDPLIG